MNFIDPEPLRCFETNGFSQMINVDTKNIADVFSSMPTSSEILTKVLLRLCFSI